MANIVRANKLSKFYGPHAAVRDLSFSIREGEVVGLLGLNGAGKTTTLRILSGLLVPTSGTVQIAGADLGLDSEEARSKIGFLPEEPPLYPEMTVDAFLRFVARINRVDGTLDAAVQEALEATDLVDARHARIDTLSQGFKRRVGIAHAIVHRPALILLDEPTSSLDPKQIVHMRGLIRGLRAKHTIIISSHILSEIHEMCDRIFVLRDGEVAAEGTETELAGRVAKEMTLGLEVRGTPAALAKALTTLDSVTQHEIHDAGEGVARAGVVLESDIREELARALSQAKLGIRRLYRTQAELESIFLELTADAAAEDGLPRPVPVELLWDHRRCIGDLYLADGQLVFLCLKDSHAGLAAAGKALARQLGVVGMFIRAVVSLAHQAQHRQELDAARNKLHGLSLAKKLDAHPRSFALPAAAVGLFKDSFWSGAYLEAGETRYQLDRPAPELLGAIAGWCQKHDVATQGVN